MADYDCFAHFVLINKIMKKYLKSRTKSEVAHDSPSPFLTQDGPHSRTAYLKFKPFSQDCTILNIHERLLSFRRTTTHFRKDSRPSTATQPLMSRLGSIIKGGKKRRMRQFTEADIHSEGSSHNNHMLTAKLQKLRRQSQIITKRYPTQHSQKKEKQQSCQFIVRQDLSHLAVEQENAFFETMQKPGHSEVLVDFNKKNCYLFSRSKHKVMVEDLQKPRFAQPQKVQPTNSGHFTSFSTYFYGGYMKNYKERRRMLSKKSTLSQIVAHRGP